MVDVSGAVDITRSTGPGTALLMLLEQIDADEHASCRELLPASYVKHCHRMAQFCTHLNVVAGQVSTISVRRHRLNGGLVRGNRSERGTPLAFSGLTQLLLGITTDSSNSSSMMCSCGLAWRPGEF